MYSMLKQEQSAPITIDRSKKAAAANFLGLNKTPLSSSLDSDSDSGASSGHFSDTSSHHGSREDLRDFSRIRRDSFSSESESEEEGSFHYKSETSNVLINLLRQQSNPDKQYNDRASRLTALFSQRAKYTALPNLPLQATEKELTEAMKPLVGYPPASHEMGIRRTQQANFSEAIEWFQHAYQRGHQLSAEPLYKNHTLLQNHAQALELFPHVLQANPDNMEKLCKEFNAQTDRFPQAEEADEALGDVELHNPIFDSFNASRKGKEPVNTIEEYKAAVAEMVPESQAYLQPPVHAFNA